MTPFPEWLQAFDEATFLKLHRFLHDLGARDALRFANELGNGYVLGPILFAVVVLTRDWRHALALALPVVLAMSLSGFATDNLKDAFPRDRPHRALAGEFAEGRAVLEFDDARAGRSFPSGHTGAVFAWATVLFVGTRRSPPGWRRRAARAALILFPVETGLARVFSGAHFPLDVLAGAAVGCAAALLATWACSFVAGLWARRGRNGGSHTSETSAARAAVAAPRAGVRAGLAESRVERRQ